MRKEDQSDTEAPAPRGRKRAVAGIAGLTVLGGMAFAITATQDGTRDEAGGITASTGPPPEVAAGPAATAGAAVSPDPSNRNAKRAPSLPAEVVSRVAAIREAAKKHTVPITRPLPQSTGELAGEVTVTTSGSVQRDGRTMRLISARADLTGQRELAWVADGGEPVGKARCSQTFRLASNVEPARKPNLLICWRTSATKSVYTVMVDLDGDPSERTSTAAIDAEWRKLG